MEYDAILLLGFGGPEKKDDVLPFLENVTRGRGIPRERLLGVAEHYYEFGGKSPLNDHMRALLSRLSEALPQRGIDLPIYWGNRNWHPMIEDVMAEIVSKGHQRVITFVPSAYSSYSSCRQYREDIERARAAVGAKAPEVHKIRPFYNHPRFVAANVDCLRDALEQFSEDEKENLSVVYTAHSLPMSMAEKCDYEAQLAETCRLVAEGAEISADSWQLVYQSRSGRPSDPWLEPDVCDHVEALAGTDTQNVIVMAIGFLSDHMEVLFDLDQEAADACKKLGLKMVRAKTVWDHPQFMELVVDLIKERLDTSCEIPAVGSFGPRPHFCVEDCCPAPVRPGRPAAS